jgi:hypothetical protein
VPAHELDAAEAVPPVRRHGVERGWVAAVDGERGHGGEAEREAMKAFCSATSSGCCSWSEDDDVGDAPPRAAKSSAPFPLPFPLRGDRTGRETATAAGRWMATSGIRSCYGSSAVFSLTAEDANPINGDALRYDLQIPLPGCIR